MNKETSEIAKLTERISKDPKSKLFVPLAEEYKKAGDIEMAIHVLSEGLKNNPGYVTARSVLGKLLLERGDLEGSQKEFEEVVKAIPDNLMAQKKLGDVFVLRNRPEEALPHYKIVFSINPRDADLASLISDIESGRDVRQKVPQPKFPQAPDTATMPSPVSQTPALQPLTQGREPGTDAGTKGSSGQAAQQAQSSLSRSASSSATPPPFVLPTAGPEKETVSEGVAPASFPGEVEEPEEILNVESLDEPRVQQDAASPAFDFLEDKESVPAAAADAGLFENGISEIDRSQETAANSEPLFDAQFSGLAGDAADEASTSSIFSGTIEEVDGRSRSAPAAQSDDFTTDTLAELYIAQGFYEKAIDIYERMLADKPHSKGLKDKLERVKAMAAASIAEEAMPAGTGTGPTPVPDGAKEYRPAKQAEKEREGDAFLSSPGEYVPVVDGEEFMVEAEVLADQGMNEKLPGDGKRETGIPPEKRRYRDAEGGVHESPREKLTFSDFEPREYVPPKEAGEPATANGASVRAAQQQSGASKKATIDRLETWLQSIKKEK